MSEWKAYKLIDIIELIGGGTPKTSNKEYWDGDIPWLSVADFNNGKKYVIDTEKKITKAGLNDSSTKVLNKGDIIISARGTVGIISMLGMPMSFNQSCYGIRAKNGLSFNDYIFYLLKDTVSGLKQIAHGGVFDTITRDTFKELDILLPPLSEQKSIASILSSLDDKIDLLHRQNATLEKMAETLFRKWFVEEAKEEWQSKKLGIIAEVQNGYAFSSRDYVEFQLGHLEVLKMGHIEKGGGLRTNPKRDYVPRNPKIEKWILNMGDIVMAMTDMKDNVVILGVPAMIDKDDNYVLNQRVARIYLKDNLNLISNYLLYVQLKEFDFIQNLQSKANSGVQVNLSTESIRDCDIIIPPIELQNDLGRFIIDLYKKKEHNDLQIQNLTKLRETILPKLMSGEVTVDQ